MSAATASSTPPETSFDWRATLAELAPRLEATERRCDQTKDYVADNMALLREHGFFALAVPSELGGAGLLPAEVAEFLRTLARTSSATALTMSMHTHPVAFAAWRWRHQKAPTDALLRRIAAERLQILTSGGSDWLPGSGIATKVEGGYKIDGRKVFASGAPSANLFMTMAVEQTPEGPMVMHIAVPLTSPGISIVETWDTMGMRGTASHDVVFENVFVPDAAVSVRRPSGAWHPIMHTISMVAFPLVYAVYTGIAEAACEIAIAAAKRKGTPSVDLVGELQTEWTATRVAHESMVAFAAVAQPGEATTSEIFTYRSLIARSALRTVELALEVAGGASYFRKQGLERLFRDIQGARFHPLRPAEQRKLAGRVALGLPVDEMRA
ncbi:MAG TPA: acyl-CoA dehydrogenase family protein [Hyphomicrobiaceae bacterium]|nr:acyl-CoA dehydrogenase family protein [Hyphomicrobiaceae bacterium]